jgi:hypothetical protein
MDLKAYTTKARKYKNTKPFSAKKIIRFLIFSCSRGASACAARPPFRVFVVNLFFLSTHKLGCLDLQILLFRFAKKTLILTPCFDIKKPPPKKKKPVNGIQRRL